MIWTDFSNGCADVYRLVHDKKDGESFHLFVPSAHSDGRHAHATTLSPTGTLAVTCLTMSCIRLVSSES